MINIFLIRTTPGFKNFESFILKYNNNSTQEKEAYKLTYQSTRLMKSGTSISRFHDKICNNAIQQEALKDNERELLQWHYRLCHFPFGNLKVMAMRGLILKHLAKIKMPVFIGCAYGKAVNDHGEPRGQFIQSIEYNKH